jgi:hypothetical protein
MPRRLCFPAFRKKPWINEESHRLSIAEDALTLVLPQNDERKSPKPALADSTASDPLSSPTIPGGITRPSGSGRWYPRSWGSSFDGKPPLVKAVEHGVTLPESGGEESCASIRQSKPRE